MAKPSGVAGILVFLFNRKEWLQGRRLSSDEAQLLESYRALSKNDQVAMRYLVGAMKNVSRF